MGIHLSGSVLVYYANWAGFVTRTEWNRNREREREKEK
jgi:hypothetical protein